MVHELPPTCLLRAGDVRHTVAESIQSVKQLSMLNTASNILLWEQNFVSNLSNFVSLYT